MLAYWGGIAVKSTNMAKYHPEMSFPNPNKSLLEIDPCMSWNPAVLGGVGIIHDPEPLYTDMHEYLNNSGNF